MIGLSRMISISARAGIDIYTIIDQLNSTGNCPSYSVRRATRGDTSKGSCCPMLSATPSLTCHNEVQEDLRQSAAVTQGDVPVKKAPVKPKADKKVTAESIFCLSAASP